MVAVNNDVVAEIIHTRTQTVWVEDGIVRGKFYPGAEETLEDAKASLEAVRKLSRFGKLPGLLDLRNLKSITKEARAYYATEGRDMGPACALLVDSHLTVFIGNFFMKFDKPKFLVRMFSNEDKAIEWLKRSL